MTFTMYLTIWAAMILLVAGDAGKGRRSAVGVKNWAWRTSAAGALLCGVHIAVALAGHHGGSHQHAIQETAVRTAAVYGLAWGGGVYVNYLFLGTWIGEALWWGISPATYAARAAWLTWATRLFCLVVVVNAAVIFARPAARFAGAALVASLLWVWARPLNASPA